MEDFASAEICFGIFFAFCSRRPNKKWFVLNSFGIETPWIRDPRTRTKRPMTNLSGPDRTRTEKVWLFGTRPKKNQKFSDKVVRRPLPWIINVRWPIREHAVTENWPISSNDRIHGPSDGPSWTPSSFWIEFPSWYSSLPRKISSENIFSRVFTVEISTGLKVLYVLVWKNC